MTEQQRQATTGSGRSLFTSPWFFGGAMLCIGFVLALAITQGLGLRSAEAPSALLAPFILLVIVFCIVVVAFAFEARRHFAVAAEQVNLDVQAQLNETQTNFLNAIDSIRKESVIVFEQDFNNSQAENRCYQRLIELVNEAKSSIFIVPNPYVRVADTGEELHMRDDYLRSIETKIHVMNRDNKPFEYIRIQQVPADFDGDLKEHVGKSEWAHLERVYDIDYANKRVLYIKKTEITGQIIIDEETFINLITTVGSSGRKRLVAIAIMKDPATDNIKSYFNQLKTGLLTLARDVQDPRLG
ncbi:MAG: hypothetical protein AB8G17_14595 [Gammaproteobacteria bacterium]